MRKILFLGIVILKLFTQSNVVYSQRITINSTITPADVINNVLLGSGVVATNIKYNGVALDALSAQPNVGSFTGGTAVSFPYNTGVALSTNGATGTVVSDPDLTAIASGAVKNGALIEFDFVAVGDTLSFKYIFASSEYTQYNCSQYNDVFGFFLSGPGISGPYSNSGINIAKIPNKNVAVSINSVNSGVIGTSFGCSATYCTAQDPSWASNSIYFTKSDSTKYSFKGGGAIFRGGTVSLPSTAVLRCGQTYHIKLAVANVYDVAFNSVVYLEAGSFSTGTVKADFAQTSVTRPFGDNVLVAGCNSRRFVFRRANSNVSKPMSFTYTTSGTAVLNTDYTLSATGTLTIPANQDTVGLTLLPIHGGPSGSMKTVTIKSTVVGSSCTGNNIDSTKISLLTAPTITVTGTTSPTTCGGTDGTISLSFTNVVNGTYTLNYNNGTTKSITVASNAGTLTGMSAGSYTNIYFNKSECTTGGPTATVTAPVPVITSQISSAGGAACVGGSLTALSVTATNVVSYQWYSNTSASTSGASIIASATSSTYTPLTSSAGTKYYYCTLTNACGSVNTSFSGSYVVSSASVSGTVAGTQSVCSGSTPGTSLTLTGNTGSVTKWQKSLTVGFTSPTDIVSSATTLTGATIGSLSSSTYFRAIVTNGACTSASTTPILITVDATTVGGTVAGAQTICTGTSPGTSLTLSGNTGSVTKWQKSTDALFTSPAPTDIVSTSTTLTGATIGSLSANTYFRAVITNGSCPLAYSSNVLISIDATTVSGSVSGSQTICSGTSPGTSLVLTGNTGSVTKWQKASDFAFTTPTDIVSTATTLTGATIGNLSSSTYFKAFVKNGSCNTLSTTPVLITVDATSVGGSVSGTQTICSGTQPLTSLVLTGKTGSVTKWQKASDLAFTSPTDIVSSATTLTGAVIGSLSANTYFRAVVTSGSCPASNSSSILISIDAPSVGGTVSGTQTICSGTSPGTSLILSGNTGSVTKWQKASDFAFTSPTDIVSTSTTLTGATIGTLSASTYFRAVVADGVCTSANSSSVLISVDAVSVGGTVAGVQSICTGSVPGISLVLSGNNGVVTKWEKSLNSLFTSPTDIISTATTLTGATIGTLSSSTYFRAVVTNGTCTSANSSNVLITVNALSVGGTVSGAQTICSGTQPGSSLVLSGKTGTVTKWQKASDLAFTVPTDIVSSATTLTGAVIGTLTASTYFRAIVTNGACSSDTSTTVLVTVNPLTPISSQPSTTPQTVCIGGNFVDLNVSAIGTGLTYQWYSNAVNSSLGGVIIGGEVNPTYAPSSGVAGTTYYYCMVHSACGDETSNPSGAFVVNPGLPISTQPSTATQTQCQGNVFSSINVVSATGISYEWYSNSLNDNLTGTIIGGATSDTYTPSSTTVGTTYYYCKVTSGCGIEYSNPSGAFIVNPIGSNFITGESLATQTICNGSTFTPISVSTTGTNLTYKWYSNTSPVASGGNELLGETSVSYTPNPSVVGTMYYYCEVKGACDNSIQPSTISGAMIVNPTASNFITGESLATQVICNGLTFSSINISATGTNLAYQWFSNTSATKNGGTLLIGSNSLSFTPSSSSVGSMYYYCVVTGGCDLSTDTSSVSGVMVVNPTAPHYITSQNTLTQTICQGSVLNPLQIIALGTNLTYKWFKNSLEDTINGTQILGATSPNFTPDNSISGINYYYCKVTGGCDHLLEVSPVSGAIIINPTASNFITSESLVTQTICSGLSFSPINVTTTGNNVTYEWFSNTVSSKVGGTSLGITTSSYTPSSAVVGTKYYFCVATGGCDATTDTSNVSGAMIVNPIATNFITGEALAHQTICVGSSFTPISVSTIGTNLSFKWYSNTSPVASGGNVLLGQTSASYTPDASVVGTIYYYCEVKGACDNSIEPSTISGAMIVNPVSTYVISQSTATQTVCVGSSFSPISVTTATGTTLTYQWFSNTVPQSFGGTSLGAGAQTSTYTPSSLALGTLYYYCEISNPGCGSMEPSQASGAMIVNPTSTYIMSQSTATQTVCLGASFSPISVTTALGTTLTYQWFSNTVPQNFGGTSLGASAQTSTYTPSSLAIGTVFYYCEISNTGCGLMEPSQASGAMIVNPTSSYILSQSTATQTVCLGSPFTAISVTTAIGTTLTYQWFSNTVPQSFGGTSLGAGAQTATYTPSSLALGTLYYYCEISNPSCGSMEPSPASGAMIVNPTSSYILSQSTATQTVCLGASFSPISVTTAIGTTLTYQWFSNTVPQNFGGTSLGAGAQAATYTPSSLVLGTLYYYCEISNSGCGLMEPSQASGAMIVNPTSSYILSQSTATQTVCVGSPFSPISVTTAIGTTLTYQWFSNTVPQSTGGVSLGAGAQTSTYTPSSSALGTLYYYCEISNPGCGSMEPSQASGAMIVNPTSSYIVSHSTATQTVCLGSPFTAISVTTATGTTLTYQWFSNTVPQSFGGTSLGAGAQTATYTPSSLAVGTLYYYCEISNPGCGSMEPSVVSGAMIVNPTSSYIISQSTSTQTVCVGSPFSPISVTTATGTTLTYQWFSNTVPQSTGGVSLGAGAQTSTYTPSSSALGTLYYYCEISNPGCGSMEPSQASGAMIVNPTSSYIVSHSTATQTVCLGSPFTAISITTATGTTLTYQWFSNTVPQSFGGTSLGAGAQTSTYTPGSLAVGTLYYYCEISNSGCGSMEPSAVSGAMIVNPLTSISSQITAPQILCLNDVATTLSVSAVGANLSYQWYSNLANSNVGGALITGQTASTLVPSSQNLGTQYYYCKVSGSCGPSDTSLVSGAITVMAPSTITLLVPGLTENRDTCFNIPIKEITYSIGGSGTGVSVVGLPAGLTSNNNGGVLTISGTSSVSGLFNYTISTTGGCSLPTKTGTINIRSVINSPVVSSDKITCEESGIENMTALSSSNGILEWASDNSFGTILGQGVLLAPSATIGTTTYFVRENLNGCFSDASSINITVKYCNIETPSAFTPDGDNVNDTWNIPHLDASFPKNVVSIYDRWGLKVFESPVGQYESNKWDGKFEGKVLPVESYFYIINYNDSSVANKNGTVTIIIQNK